MATLQARGHALPALDGERCVHAAIETATCRACVKVCPHGAWRLDDAALEFDGGLCDGCGLCVPACPCQAIVLPLALTLRPVAGTNAMLAACDRAGGDAPSHGEPGYIACLHAIGLAELLHAYRAGQHAWLLAHADCASCPRGQGESLFTRVAYLNAALRQRGRRPIVLREVSLASWTALINAAGTAAAQARRGFFRALSRQPAAVLLGAPPLLEKERAKPPGEYLPDGDDALMPWVLRIDATRCIGCHACTRVCPEQAIRFDEVAPAYRLHHRACTGCGLCRDVCESQAVVPQPWAEPRQASLPLVKQYCRGCGVAFHKPAEVAVGSPHCWICSRPRLTRRLYQVME